jgi:TRAP-type C4-dicarboxylate transport system permease small subunit
MFSLHSKLYLDKWIANLLIIFMALMVLNVTWQVASRFLLQDPSSFTDELSRYLLIWVGMLGSAYVAGKNEHLAIDILINKLKGNAQIKLLIFIQFLILIFALFVMVLGGSNLVYITFMLGQKSATLQLPLSFIYGIIPFSGLLIIYYEIVTIIQLIKSLKKD